jgi:hypothetical protein
MKCFGMLVCLLLAGCGFVATENKLAGTWQVDLPPPQKIVYVFQKDHTYTMMITGQAGAMQGTWRLDGNILTMTLGSFAVYGMTNVLPSVQGLSAQKNTIVTLTDSAMDWRGAALAPGLKLKRVTSLPSVGQSSP